MYTYTDRKGRTWNVELDLQKAMFVDNSDFTDHYDGKVILSKFDKALIGEVFTNSRLLFGIIWAIVQDQAKAKWKSYSAWLNDHQPDTKPPPDSFPADPADTEKAQLEFVSGVNGKVVEAARQAFLESLSDFFQDHQNALLLLLEKHKTMRTLMVEKLGTASDQIDKLLEQEMDKGLAELKSMLDQPGTTSTT